MTVLPAPACGIAQQYSSATFTSILFSLPQKKIACFKNIIESFFLFEILLQLKFRKMNHVSRSVRACVCVCVCVGEGGGGCVQVPYDHCSAELRKYAG